MHLLQVTTVGCIFLVFVLVSWLPQLGSSANIEGQADPSVRSTHVGLNELRARKRQNYRQVDYDYDEEENEEEEAEEELEAAINDTKSGGTEAEEGENNENDEEEEEEDEYDEDEGRALKRKYLIEKFMRIKL